MPDPTEQDPAPSDAVQDTVLRIRLVYLEAPVVCGLGGCDHPRRMAQGPPRRFRQQFRIALACPDRSPAVGPTTSIAQEAPQAGQFSSDGFGGCFVWKVWLRRPRSILDATCGVSCGPGPFRCFALLLLHRP